APVVALARGVTWFDREVLDAWVRGAGAGSRLVGRTGELLTPRRATPALALVLGGVLVLAALRGAGRCPGPCPTPAPSPGPSSPRSPRCCWAPSSCSPPDGGPPPPATAASGSSRWPRRPPPPSVSPAPPCTVRPSPSPGSRGSACG